MIARNNTGMGETITVRKISFGHGVERIFPLHAQLSITSMWFVRAECAARNCTTCADSRAKPPV